MATITVTAATLAATMPKVQGGDTVKFLGAFPGFRLQSLHYTLPVVFDASGATIGVGSYWKDMIGVTVKGGLWGSLRIDGATNIRIDGCTFAGTSVSNSIGVSINTGSSIVITNSTFSAFEFGLGVNNTSNLEVSSSSFANMMSDGMQILDIQTGHIFNNVIYGTIPSPGAHPDGIQVRSDTVNETSDLLIEDNVCTGQMQGISFFNGPYKNITIRNNDLTLGYPQGIGVYDVTNLVLQGNHVRTIQGSPYMATISIVRPVGPMVRTGNRIDGYSTWPAIIDP